MKKYYFGGSGKGYSYGLISSKPFVVRHKSKGAFKGYSTLEEAHAAKAEEDSLLFNDGGKWHEVHFIAS